MNYYVSSLVFLIMTAIGGPLLGQPQDCIFDLSIDSIPPVCADDATGQISVTPFSEADLFINYTFTWSDNPAANSGLRTGLTAGSYTVTVTGSYEAGGNGNSGDDDVVIDPPIDPGLVFCSIIRTIELTSLSPSLVLSAEAEEKTCFNSADGSIDLTVAGGVQPYSYAWSNGSTLEDQIENLFFTSYSVTVTDANQCTDSLTNINVPSPPPIAVNYEKTDVSCADGDDGSITMQMEGGVPPFTHSWSDGGTGAVRTGLTAGVYVDTILDSRGCPTNWTFIPILEPPGIFIDIDSVKSVSCAGGGDGLILVSISGGTPPYQYLWSDGNTAPDRDDLTVGSYGLTVTDSNGCEISTEPITISQPEISLSIDCEEQLPDRAEGADNGAVTVRMFEGAFPYQIRWEGRRTGVSGLQTGVALDTFNIANLPSDTFDITVTDKNNCEAICEVFVRQFFIVEEESLFIIEFDSTTNTEDIIAFQDDMENRGARRENACLCFNDGVPRLQMWYTQDTLGINTSAEGAKSRPRSDTSGISQSLYRPFEEIPIQSTALCVNIPGEGAKKYSTMVAIIDSGSELPGVLNENGHNDLAGLVKTNLQDSTINARDDELNCCQDDREGYDFLGQSNLVKDRVGHGTHIAGIISDNYPDSIDLKLINIKVYNKDQGEAPQGTVFELTCAIHYAIDQGAKVINLSLGYPNDIPSKPLYYALKRAERRGIAVIVSAGNEGEDLREVQNRWPGNFKLPNMAGDSLLSALNNLIVVGSLTSDLTDLDTTDSNFAPPHVDFATRAEFYSTSRNPEEYVGYRGTSMAAAYVTRLVSILRAYRPELSPQRIRFGLSKAMDTIRQADLLSMPGGKLNPARLMRFFNLASLPITKFPDPELTRNDFIPIPTTLVFKRDSIDFRLVIKDGSRAYGNIGFKVHNLGKPDEVVFEDYYCNTNQIRWLGEHQDGGIVPTGQYEFIVSVNNVPLKRFPTPITID